MPLPFIAIGWYGALAAAAAILAAGTVALNWDKILILFKGKHLAILGARGVGKTHLRKFLTTGSIPAEYKQTVAPEKTPKNRFQLKELDIKIKEGFDISGDKAAYAEWKKLHDKAHIVFYLLRVDRLIAGDNDVETRVRADMRHIGGWIEEKKQDRPELFIIGTHCDCDPAFVGLTKDKIADYTDKFRRLPVIHEIVSRGGGALQVKVVIGSMKTVVNTEALVFQIFNQATT